MSEVEAEAMQRRYLELLRRLANASEAWPAVAQIDDSPRGKMPRVNLSIKLSSLCARFDPLDPNTEATVCARLRELLREAARLSAGITVDMEQYAFKDLTLEIFRAVLQEEEFHERPHAAIALQAYLRDAEADIRELIQWARRVKRRIGVRLVKGAYWDSEIAWAKQKGWPIPVYLEKAQTDASYESASRLLLENHDVIDAALGSHNLRSLAHAMVTAKSLGLPSNGYEIQMLYGMAEPVRRAKSPVVCTGTFASFAAASSPTSRAFASSASACSLALAAPRSRRASASTRVRMASSGGSAGPCRSNGCRM